ncbi:MAG: hypothetical protein IPP71_14930 [Bacteroidetes bacterium]|nr:hypothetical protein [Bacteroidota bacterium]
MATIELNIGRYEDAKTHYEKFLSFQGAKESFKENARKRILSCDFAINALKNPVPFNPQNLGENINSPYDEYFPTITVDDQMMFYTRNRPDSEGSQRFHEDFYISKKNGNSFGKSGMWGRAN